MNRNQFNSPFNRINSPDLNRQPYNVRESPSPDFIPFNYSSPLSSMKGGSRHFNKPYNKSAVKLNDRSFSSPLSNGSSFSPNNSSGSFGSNNRSGQYNRTNNFNRNGNMRFQHTNNKSYNSDLYFNASMIEDPWECLEKKLIEELGAENVKISKVTVKEQLLQSMAKTDEEEGDSDCTTSNET